MLTPTIIENINSHYIKSALATRRVTRITTIAYSKHVARPDITEVTDDQNFSFTA